jgi:hypothetical protein
MVIEARVRSFDVYSQAAALALALFDLQIGEAAPTRAK